MSEALAKLRELQRTSQTKHEQLAQTVRAKAESLAATSSLGDRLAERQVEQLRQLAQTQQAAAEFRAKVDNALPTSVAAFGSGSGALVSNIGTLYGLASGDMDNALRTHGERVQNYYNGRKSPSLEAAEARRQARIEAADGEVAKMGTAFLETIMDPELATSIIAENIPNLAVMGAGGRIVTGAAGEVAGTAAAMGMGGLLQGGDVGSNTYQRIKNTDKAVLAKNETYQQLLAEDKSPDEALEIMAQYGARQATALAFTASVITQRALPAVPAALASGGRKGGAGLIGGAVQEGVQEAAEEGLGAVSSNVGVRVANPEQSLTEGSGEAAGLGAAGGALTGGPIGAVSTAAAGAERVSEEIDKRLKEEAAVEKAVETGDVSDIEDSEVAADVLATRQIDGTDSPEALDTLVEELRQEAIAAAEDVRDTAQAIDEGTANINDEQYEAKLAKMAETQAAYSKAVAQRDRVRNETQRPQPEEIDETISKTAEGDVEAHENIKALLMEDIDAFTDDQLDSLVERGNLTEEEQAVVAAYKEEKEVAGHTAEVTQAIMNTGTSGFKGLKAFRSDIQKALAKRDMETVTSEVEKLQSFQSMHQQKLEVFESARARMQETGKRVYIFQDKGTYKHADQAPTRPFKTRDGSGNFVVSPGRQGLNKLNKTLRGITAEVEAINATTDTITAQVRLSGSTTQQQTPPADIAPPVDTANLEDIANEQAATQSARKANTSQQENATQDRQDQAGVSAEQDPGTDGTAPGRVADDAYPQIMVDDLVENLVAERAVNAKGELIRFKLTENTEEFLFELNTKQYKEAVAAATSRLHSPATSAESQAATPEASSNAGETNTVEAEARAAEPAADDAVSETEENPAVEGDKEVIQEGQPVEDGPDDLLDYEDYASEYAEDGETTNAEPEIEPGDEVVPVTDEEGGIVAVPAQFLENAQPLEALTTLDQLNDPEFDILGAWFTQQAVSNEKQSQNPLLTVKDWISQVTGKNGVEQFMPEGYSPAVNRAVRVLADFARSTGRTAVRRVNRLKTEKPEHARYRPRRLVALLKGKVDQNLQTAMSYAMASWLAENHDQTLDHKSIMRLTNPEDSSADDKKVVDGNVYDSFAEYNNLNRHVAKELGDRALKAYGIKKANEHTPNNALDNLSIGLGQALVIAMIEDNILEQNRLQWDGKEYNMIKVQQNLPKAAVDVVTAFRDAGRDMDTLFSASEFSKGPALEPGQNTQTHKRGGIPLTETQQAIADKTSRDEYRFKTNVARVTGALSRETQEAVAGVKPVNHPGLKASIEGANKGLKRELDLLWENFNRYKDQALYFPMEFWKQNRAGYASSDLNPQTSKVQRAHLAQKAWDYEVDPAKPETVYRLKLAIALGLDLKVDKEMPEDVLTRFDEFFESDEAKKAMAALDKALRDESLDDADNAAILAAVNKGEENFHSFEALVAWAEFQRAEGPYTTNLMFEIDGLVNGPALSLVMTGTMDYETGRNAGFYPEANMSYPEHRTRLNGERRANNMDDLYEDWIKSFERNINALVNNEETRAKKLVDAMPDLFQLVRDTAKTPVQSTFFSAGAKSALDNLSDELIVKYYEELAKTFDARNWDQFNHLVKQINYLLPKNKRVHPKGKTRQAVLTSTVLNPEQVEALQTNFFFALREPFNTTMQEKYGPFMALRDQTQGAADALFERYHNAKEWLLDYNRKTLVDAGQLPADYSIDLPTSVYAQVDRELKELMPFIHTLFSQQDGNRFAGYKATGRRDRVLAEDTRERDSNNKLIGENQNASFSQEVVFEDKVKGVANHKAKSTYNVTNYRAVETAPGAATFVGQLHGTDGYIAHKTLLNLPVTNIHDAVLLGVGQMFEAGNLLNKRTWEAMVEYNIADAVAKAMEDSIVAQDRLVEKYGEELNRVINRAETSFETQRQALRIAGLEAEIRKLEFLQNINSVGQYVATGTEYQPTEQDKQRVQRKLDDARRLLANLQDQPPATVNVDPGQPGETEWGKVGNFAAAADPSLLSIVQEADGKHPRVLLKQMIALLDNPTNTYFNQPSRRQFYKALLQQIEKVLPAKATVMYITPETKPESWSKEVRTGKGFWKPMADGSGVLGIKSPEFDISGISMEMLTHELIHSVLRATIANPTTAAAKRAKANLEEILEAIQEKMAGTQYAKVVRDVDELVSWGLTNSQFQTEILSQVQMPMDSAASWMGYFEAGYSALQKFVNTVSEFFFGKKRAKAGEFTAMGSLIYNSAVLMDEANNSNQIAEGPPSLMASLDQDNFTAEQIYSALWEQNQPLSRERSDQLAETLNQVVTTVYGPTGALRAAALRNAPQTPDDIYLTSVAEGQAPFSSKFVKALGLTQQEGFVGESVEVTMRTLLDHPANKSQYHALRKLFTQARDTVKPSDLHPNPQAGQRIHRLLFTIEGGKRSDYVSQFVAASIAYKPLHDALAKIQVETTLPANTDRSIIGRLKHFMNQLFLNWENFRAGVKPGSSSQQAILKLARDLATIEARKQGVLKRREASPLAHLEAMVDKGAEGARARMEKFMASDLVARNRFTVVKAAGAASEAVLSGSVETILERLTLMRTKATNERLGLMGEFWNEASINREGIDWAVRMADQQNHFDQQRKEISVEMSKWVMERFREEPTDDQSHALSRTIIRGDAHAVFSTGREMQEVLGNERVHLNRIAALEAQLTGDHSTYYLTQARSLALRLATGEVVIDGLNLNAHNIARGRGAALTITEEEATAAEPIIDQLVTLQALQYMRDVKRNDKSLIDLTLEVLRSERNRSDELPNAVDDLLKIVKTNQAKSMEALFKNNPTLMEKGYMKEKIDPEISVMAANSIEGKQLMKAGYAAIGTFIEPDLHDPTHEKRQLYVSHDGGLSETLGGFMSTTGRTAAGWEAASAAEVGNQVAAMAAKQNKGSRNFDPRKVKTASKMVPTYNEHGNVANYRYLMTDMVKDTVMRRQVPIHKVLGDVEASIFDKMTSPGINRQAVTLLKKNYDEEHLKEPQAFIRVSAHVKDPVIRERWNTLPLDTKRFIRKVWGEDGMWVRKDVFNIAMGYRKYSVKEFLEKAPETQSAFERVMANILGQVPLPQPDGSIKYLPSKRALRIIQAGDVVEELVKMVKDIWVIKNVVTLMGNEMSNMSMLYLQGVPLHKIVKGKIDAHNATLKYNKERQERDSLQRQVDHGLVVGPALTEATQRIAELTDSMERSQVHTLMEAGLFQTLIEDIDRDEDPYSYSTRLTRWADEKTARVPPMFKTAGKYLLMTHDTPHYRLLNNLTMYSDFTARVVLYEHLTTRRNNPLAHNEAIRESRAAFVNYDIPSHRGIQWMNDKGLFFFTKYYMRIQMTLLRLIKDNPVKAAALIGINDVLAYPSVTESSILNGKFPFKLSMGPLELPGALDELGTVKALDAVF